jgi:8-oxo-dGTP pyrophosphatase MutT (NUDIX family)
VALRESVAKILLINEKDEALMLRIGDYQARPERSHTADLPGGLVDPGEFDHDAVLRELDEEAGIDVPTQLVKLVYAETEYYPEQDKSVTKLLYTAKLSETPQVTISWEHEAYEWHNVNNFADHYTLRSFYDRAVRYVVSHHLI